jgi:hypothetical protein
MQGVATDYKLHKVNTAGVVTRVTNLIGGNNDNIAVIGTWDYNNDSIDDFLMIRAGVNSKIMAITPTDEILQIADINGSSGEDLPTGGASYDGYFYFGAWVDPINSYRKLYRLKYEYNIP